MLLRKSSRSYQKDQEMGDVVVDSQSFLQKASELNKSCVFSLPGPGLFVGFNPKCSEPDSVRSPTSPLDFNFRVLSNLSSSFVTSPSNHRKVWDSTKVGLSIVDSLDRDADESKKILRASGSSRNLLLRPQVRIVKPNSSHHMTSFEATKSLPKGVGIFPSNLQKGSSDVMFHTGDASFEPKSSGNSHPSSLDSARYVSPLSRFASSFAANHVPNPASGNFSLKIGEDRSGDGTIPREIELSEDYTCVISHGPNPKVTHIFCDCILDCHSLKLTKFDNNNKDDPRLSRSLEACKAPAPYPSSHFLSFCYSCKKKLDGEDIYMYRGEKAFCSSSCRLQEILIDEEMEKSDSDVAESSTKPSPNIKERSKSGLFIFS